MELMGNSGHWWKTMVDMGVFTSGVPPKTCVTCPLISHTFDPQSGWISFIWEETKLTSPRIQWNAGSPRNEMSMKIRESCIDCWWFRYLDSICISLRKPNEKLQPTTANKPKIWAVLMDVPGNKTPTINQEPVVECRCSWWMSWMFKKANTGGYNSQSSLDYPQKIRIQHNKTWKMICIYKPCEIVDDKGHSPIMYVINQ